MAFRFAGTLQAIALEEIASVRHTSVAAAAATAILSVFFQGIRLWVRQALEASRSE